MDESLCYAHHGQPVHSFRCAVRRGERSGALRQPGGVDFFGVKFVGINAENGQKLVLTLMIIGVVLLLAYLLKALACLLLRKRDDEHKWFWTNQAINLLTTAFLVLGLLSIWFDDPTRLATALGLVTAGLAFALQKVVMAVAGYFVILRGNNFTVGDRITMGGVRGDVIALGFIQNTIMEMGQPPSVQAADPAMWVQSRQFTGRIVTVSNAQLFDEPVYNYTRDFPYIWEEMALPIPYTADRQRAEQILLETAARHTLKISELSEESLRKMHQRYYFPTADLDPKVFYRLTDNWLELAVRFLVRDHDIRSLKDAISREILAGLEEAGIGIASTTIDIVGFPTLHVQNGARHTQANS